MHATHNPTRPHPKRATLLAGLIAALGFLGIAGPAVAIAAAEPAPAGIAQLEVAASPAQPSLATLAASHKSGDFYRHYACSINSSGSANLDITNYDAGAGKQTYHMDMDSPSGYQADALYFDGVKQPGWNDRYKTVSDRDAHTIKGVWLRGSYTWAEAVSCQLRF